MGSMFIPQQSGQAVDPARIRQRDLGVERCRKEQWAEALPWLASAFEKGIPDGKGWPVAASYLGYCIASENGRYEEGARLCRHALKAEIFSSEIWHNLARIHLLEGDRRQAVEAVRRGLGYEPDDTDLDLMRSELGQRRHPPLRFLSRSNPLNRVLGRLRSAFSGSPRPKSVRPNSARPATARPASARPERPARERDTAPRPPRG
jgi:hypothetical protein